MHDARVLVVDDSAAMRALFSDILEQSRQVRVVGTAASAAEAREQIERLQPNVLTLDVEMPGTSGIEFLAEIMETAPMPVVMLSSLTQTGTDTSLKAYELGAVECFPKPLKATPDQFAKTVGKLGKIVLAAANSNVREKPKHRPVAADESSSSYEWNGRIAAMSASLGGIDALTDILAQWPANGPATVIVLNTEPSVAQAFVSRLDKTLKCSVRLAEEGALLEAGTIHVATDPAHHVVVEAGEPPVLRLVARDPIDGVRPSADLLYGTIARAGLSATGAVLTGMGSDGAKGLKLMRDAGCPTFAQDCATATVSQAPAAAIAAGAAEAELPLDKLSAAVLAACAA